jgi:hypothetical protein
MFVDSTGQQSHLEVVILLCIVVLTHPEQNVVVGNELRGIGSDAATQSWWWEYLRPPAAGAFRRLGRGRQKSEKHDRAMRQTKQATAQGLGGEK